jgi:protein-S-isoprenylcysteine O-methyltransferase Ste14
MAEIALLLDLGFVVLAFGGRTLVQLRKTGDAGWRLGRPHSRAELVARTLLAGAVVLLVVAVIAGWDTTAPPTAGIGIAIAALGIVVVLVAQLQMGTSWRIGVDPGERTPLVVAGLYARIRNPIYTGMVLFALGQALLLPNPWTVVALVAMVVGVEIQVRAVEEPFLAITHGPAFTQWAAQAGRFVPGVGRGLTAR